MTNKIYSACMTLVMLAIIAGGCSKNDINGPQEPAKVQKYHMVIDAAKAQDPPANAPHRVLGLDGNTLNASWVVGEEVTVYNETRNTAISGVLTAQSNGASTTLSGDLTGSIEPSDVLKLKFLSPNYTGQDGTLEYISANCDYAEASVTVASVSGGNITSSSDAVFENKQAIVKFTLISKADGTTLLNPTTLTINDGINDIITLSDIPATTYTENGDGILFVAIPGFANKNIKLSVTVGTKIYIYDKDNVTFTNGNYYSITIKITPEGALPYGFSVSPTKRVLFSKGNLQYNAALGTHQCADGTTQQGTWRFAEHQWDMVGLGYGQIGNNYCDIGGTVQNSDNRQISSTYNGWIDHFGWGTSGWDSGANAYQPWSTSIINSDYFPNGSSSNNLTEDYANADWGVYNQIGNDFPNTWRTLTKEEWDYLLNTRANAVNKYCAAKVNGITGMVILPDEWTLPSGCFFIAGMTSASDKFDWSYVNASNIYNGSQWQLMEANGAAFLPCAGNRPGTIVRCVGTHGSYWSSTGINPEGVYLDFFSFYLNWESENYFYGRSIRVVQDL